MLRHAAAAVLVAAPAAAQAPPEGVTRPRPDLKTYLEMLDRFPSALKKRGQDGDVTVTLCVTATGRAKDVRVVTPSGNDLLDKAVVEGLPRTRFVPAQDASGRKVDFCDPPYEMVVQWRTPQ